MRKKNQDLDSFGYLAAVTNNLSGGLIVVNGEGKIIHYNAAALDLLNTNADLSGKHISEILHLKDKHNKPFAISDKLKKTKVFKAHDDVRYTVGPDECIRLELSISPIRSNSNTITGHVLFLRDITKAKTLEEERNEFIGVVSHELRTPVAIMEGTISNLRLMIERGMVKKSTLFAALSTTYDQIESLSGIINSLSTLSRSERDIGAVSAPIDTQNLLERLFIEYEPRAAKKSLTLNLDTTGLSTPKITTCQTYLEEIIQNFLTNAIKYTDSGSIALNASSNDSGVTISVSDTGVGISKIDQKRIFDKFYRVEDLHTRKTEGIGLGLYIAHKLAKKLGTEISLESRQGYGSTFSITLPPALASKNE
jgi:two-component system phosphate regulon sensor histidine kinase PhoR